MPSKVGFMEYLKNTDHKEWTGSGFPSTVYQYAWAVECVMKKEGIEDWLTLAENILDLVPKYDKHGTMKSFGDKGHGTVINALKRFVEYVLNATDYADILAEKWIKMGC